MSAGQKFLKKLEAVEAEMRAGSDKMAVLQEKLPDENREELSSRIDMAIGSASLILSGKCKQFRELCQKNIRESTLIPGECVDGKENEGAQFPTTEEDLEGFWDMISLPIQKVRSGFASIERLSENDWKESEVNEKVCPTKKTLFSGGAKGERPQKKPPTSNNNNNLASTAEIEYREKLARQKEEARQRLQEFKKAARNKLLLQQNGEDPDKMLRTE